MRAKEFVNEFAPGGNDDDRNERDDSDDEGIINKILRALERVKPDPFETYGGEVEDVVVDIVSSGRLDDLIRAVGMGNMSMKDLVKQGVIETLKELKELYGDQGLTEDSKEINWVNPNFDREYEEVEWQLKYGKGKIPQDVLNYYTKYFPTKQAWLKAVQNGRPVTIPVKFDQEIRNNTENKKEWLQALSPQSHDPEGPEKKARVDRLFAHGGNIEMPIILNTGKGLWLIGGKTRLGKARLDLGIPAKVWMIGGQQGVAESQSAKAGIVETDVYGVRAYHAECLEPGCVWKSRRFDSDKQAQAAAQTHAKRKHLNKKQGVAEDRQQGITVYHGNQGGIHGKLITPMWWSEDKDTAVYYATQLGGDGWVFTATLSCKNPYVITDKDETNTMVEKFKTLAQKGYDSIYDPWGHDWIPFYNKDIHVTGKEYIDGQQQGVAETILSPTEFLKGRGPIEQKSDKELQQHLKKKVTGPGALVWRKKIKDEIARRKQQGVAEGLLNEFDSSGFNGGGGGGDDDRDRRIDKLIDIAVEVGREKNVASMGMIQAMNTIAGDEWYRTNVEALLPDITPDERMGILQTAYRELVDEKRKKGDDGFELPIKPFVGDGRLAWALGEPGSPRDPVSPYPRGETFTGKVYIMWDKPKIEIIWYLDPKKYETRKAIYIEKYAKRYPEKILNKEVPLWYDTTGKRYRYVTEWTLVPAKEPGGWPLILDERGNDRKQNVMDDAIGWIYQIIQNDGDGIHFVEKIQNISENFADGRNPQDRGDSKRYRVPTKGKISTLRKIAKQGGRRGQLAHWAANMRSGKRKGNKSK